MGQGKERKEWGKHLQAVNSDVQVSLKVPTFLASTCWKTLTLNRNRECLQPGKQEHLYSELAGEFLAPFNI